MINWIREKLLGWLLPEEQFYIQGGFHSVFHPIIKSVFSTQMEDVDGFSGEDDNGERSIY
jgi:hypothetical protein